MDLSRLQWLKVVTPPKNYHRRWAYSPEAIKDMKESFKDQIIIDTVHGLTIFPLGFKSEKAQADIRACDMILLTQYAKITHIVEVLDNKPYNKGSHEKGSWFHRYVKIVWWKPEPEMKWEDLPLPRRSEIFGCDISVFDGNPHRFTSFKSFREKWGDGDSGLEAFQEHLEKKQFF